MSSDVFQAGEEELSRACRIDSTCDCFESAWKAGSRPRIEDYLAECAAPERLLLLRELIVLEIHYRRLAGEACQVHEYAGRFPELDATWLAGVIPGSPDGLSTPTVPVTSGAAANAFSTPSPGDTVSPVITGPRGSFGDYEFVGVIGESGMGIVYKAWQKSLKRTVALKTIKPGLPLSAVDVQRFRAEAEMAAHLNHPHIVPIYEVNEHEGWPYFTMKFIEGVDLARQPPELAEAQRTMAQLVATAARAVHHAHQRGILHRDLKPANILLEWQAGDVHPPVPHVADFGLAKRLDEDVRVSLEGAIVGTPVYMAPEQARGSRDLTTAVDVYGLGAILYHLLTGQAPFKADTIAETLHDVIEREPARPRTLKPGVDRDLETVCLRCLEKKPEDRIGSAEKLAEELERWLRGEPIESRSSSGAERILKWMRRRPAVAALLAVSTVAMLALVGVGVGLWYSAQLQSVNEGLSEARENLARTNGELETAIGEKEAANDQLQQEKVEVVKQRQQARRFLYVAQINLADRAHKEGKPGLALQLLESVLPKDMGGEDLRGPEWYHLWNMCNGYAYALTGHTSPITAMEFSPDGKWLAASAADGRIVLWDTREAKVCNSFQSKEAGVVALQFTDDCKVLLATGEKAPIGAWDVHSGRQLADSADSLNADTITAVSRAFNHLVHVQQEREQLATLVSRDAYGTAALLVRKDARYTSAASIVGAGGGFPAVTGLLSQNWKYHLMQRDNLPPHLSKPLFRVPSSLAIAPQNGFAILGFGRNWQYENVAQSVGGEVIVVDQREQRLVDYHRQPDVLVSSVAISVCGQLVGWGGDDNVIHIKDLEGRHKGQSFSFNSNPRLLAFSQDRHYLASAHADHTIRVWETQPPDPNGVLKVQGHVNNIAFSPMGTQLAASCAGTSKVWQIPSWKEIYSLTDLREPGASRAAGWQRLAYSADGRLLSDGLRVIELDTGRRVPLVQKGNEKAMGTAFSPDGKMVATASYTRVNIGHVLVWETTTGNLLQTLKATPEWPVSVTFSPNGKLLAAGSAAGGFRSGGVRVWEVRTGKEVHSYHPPHLSTYSVAFSPDGKWLAVGRGTNSTGPQRVQGEIRIFDTQTWAEVMSLEGHSSCVWCVVFSPDGRRLASAAGQHPGVNTPGEIKIWDLAVGQELLTLKGHTACVRGVSFSPDGKVLASCSWDGTIRLWGDLTGSMR
jgi:WD40 repeat protein